MKDTQKRFLGAVLAASSVAGIVAPSVTAMATVVEDENKATAEDLKAVIAEYTTKLEADAIFANYHRVQYAAERLAQYDANASQEALANISKYADKVFTEEVKTIVDKMDGFAASKSMASYDELVTKDIQAMTNKENAEYLMGRLDVWGKAIVFEVDPNYVKATDAIMEVANLVSAGKYDAAEKQVVVAKDAIKAIKTYEVNGAYLEGKLKIEEDKLAEKANLKVVSAEAINAKEIKVVFNRELDEDSAENEGNYTLYVGKDENGAKKTVEASLQDDNKTVILQIEDKKDNTGKVTSVEKLTNGESYKVEVKNVLDANGKKVDAYKGDFEIFNDKTAPSLVSTEYTGSTIKFTFDEPLKRDELPTVKVDNRTIKYPTEDAFSKDAGEYELTVELDKDKDSKAQDLGKHIVKISGAKDYANNTADMITTEYTATEENEKPSVESIEEDSQDTFKVTFNTRVKNLDKANFEIKKGNHTFTNDQIKPIDNKDLASDNECYVTLVNENNGDNRLYDDNEKSVELSVKVKDYEGTNEKVGDDFKGKVTLNKDEEAPQIKSENLNRVDGQKLVLLFNEDLKEAAVNEKNITIVRDGVRENALKATIDDKKLEITLNDGKDKAKNLETGTYKISLEKGTVMDKADNKNEALSTTLEYVNDNADSFQLTSEKSVVVTQDSNKNKNVVTINFGKEMSDSALDGRNYRIDGVTEDLNPSFENSDKTSVVIDIPRGSVSENETAPRITLSKDLTAKTGEYLATKSDDKEYIITKDSKTEDDKDILNGKFDDDTDPTMDKVELIKKDSNSSTTTTNVLKVTFNEDVKVDVEKAKNDFIVRDKNKDKVEVKAIQKTDDEDTIVLRLEKAVEINKGVTVEVTDDVNDNSDGMNITDKSSTPDKITNELEVAAEKSFKDVEVNKDLYEKGNKDLADLADAKEAVVKAEKAVETAEADQTKAVKAVEAEKAIQAEAVKAVEAAKAIQAEAVKAVEAANALDDSDSTKVEKVKAAEEAKKEADTKVTAAEEAKTQADAKVTAAEEAKTQADTKVADAKKDLTKAQDALKELNK